MVSLRPATTMMTSHACISCEDLRRPLSMAIHPIAWAFLLASSLLIVGSLWHGPAAMAQSGDDALGLDAQAAIPGQAQGAWAPIRVTISPAVPVEGTLEVRQEGPNGATTNRVAVEVAAGVTKQWILLVPPGEGRPTVTLTSGDLRATHAVPAFGVSSALVGVMGDAEFADRVGAVTDSITGQVWTTVDIDTNLLDVGPLALETIGTLTAPADAIAALDDTQRTALAAAVNHQGLHLVVTEVAADPQVGRAPGTVDAAGIDAVPSAWPLTTSAEGVDVGPTTDAAAASVTSGRGRVTWITDHVAADDLASPRMWGDVWTGTQLSTAQAWSRAAVLDVWSLQQSGVRLPSSWAMTAFAGGYLVLVGIVGLVVVRRLRRRELAWIVLPAMSLVLAAVAFAASSGNQSSPGRSLARATWIDGQGTEDLVVLLAPELATNVNLPGTGWAVEGLTWDNPTIAVASSEGVALTTDGGAFGLGMTMATRPTATPAPLTVEAVVTEIGLRAEITNTSDIDLTDVRLSRSELGQVDLGTLTAGATTVVELDGDGATVDDMETTTATTSWSPIDTGNQEFNAGFDQPDIAVEPGFGGRPMEDGGTDSFAAASNKTVASQPGLVWVQGLTARPIVTTPASPGAADPDVVVVGVTPTVDPAAITGSSRLLWQSTTGNVHEIDPTSSMLFGGGTTWVSTALPTAPAPGQLRIDVPRTDADDGCVEYDVFDDQFTQSRVEELCDGEVLACPDDADSCELWDQGAVICTDDVCENWELRFEGTMAVEVFDRGQEQFRPWDDAFEAAVDADPDLVVTPLGQVVVAITGNGEFPLSQVDIGTGAGK